MPGVGGGGVGASANLAFPTDSTSSGSDATTTVDAEPGILFDDDTVATSCGNNR